MKRVYITTVKRGGNLKDLTGFVYEIDIKKRKIINSVAINDLSLKNGFWNPRGGNRGARGICYFAKVLYVATATSIRKYDLDLNFLGDIRHKEFVGLHGLRKGPNGVFCLSTMSNTVLKINKKNKIVWRWNGLRSSLLKQTFGITSEIIKKNKKKPGFFFHFSGLAVNNKEVYLLSNPKSFIMKIFPTEKLIISDDSLQAPHDICFINNNLFLINNTKNQTIHKYSLTNKSRVKISNTQVYKLRKSNMFSSPGWQRGLAHYYGDKYLVGTSPLTIFEFNIKTNKIERIIKLDKDIKHSSYDICVV
jgi:hypothetical protein